MVLSNRAVCREVVMRDTSSALPAVEAVRQEPFGRVVPLLKASLLLGTGGGFLLVLVLLIARLLSFPLNVWWIALNDAYDHLQLYGWAGLFAIGIMLHFLPRLRGVPLVAPWLIPWIVCSQVIALFLRLLSQPLLVVTGASLWRVLLALSGGFECVAFGTAALLFALVLLRGTRQTFRQYHQTSQKKHGQPADSLRVVLYVGRPKRSIELGLGGAFVSMALASLVNLGNVLQAAGGTGLVLGQGDSLNVTLGLFGFLVPVALMLSAYSLPAYVERKGFPQQVFWPLSAAYFVGLAFTFIGMSWTPAFPWLRVMSGSGMILLSLVLLTFITVFLSAMGLRKRLLLYVVTLQGMAQPDQAARLYGPFVLLIASSYLWAALGALLLGADGVAVLLGMPPFLAPEAMHYSFASGFIALLLSGVSVRMFPDFSGLKIAGSAWVTALFWIGNVAALLHVGPLLFLPLLVAWGNMGLAVYGILFDFAGLFGVAFAICLAISLWPVLRGNSLFAGEAMET
jgi:uncharacterized protein involved in response to NO